MKTMLVGALTLAITAGSVASAQPYGNGPDRGRNGQQNDRGQAAAHTQWGQDYGGGGHRWQRGQRIGYNDWHSAPAVDYRRHHLRQPPRGYEWRESNGQYILAAAATGVIASIIMNSGR
jgi:Ni/Co efflux regulator RcnB